MPPPSPLRTAPFKQVDVFTSEAFRGNALAVVLDAEGLSSADMQRIAAWTNLSETTFVLPPTRPQADYRLRIFTPRRELPFAGHPSVGTAHALLEAGRLAGASRYVQECTAGLLPVRVLGDGHERRIFVRAPQARLRDVDADVIAAAARALGAEPAGTHAPRIADNGPIWLLCDLGTESVVRALKPDFAAVAAVCSDVGAIGVGVFGRAGSADYARAVRVFCPGESIPEDPVTGSANAAIGAYLQATGQCVGPATYRVSQGREVGREGCIDVEIDSAGNVDIGGRSVTVIDGTVLLPR